MVHGEPRARPLPGTLRRVTAGAPTGSFPLLAGLREVMPWVRQWHGEYDDEWGDVPADELEAEYENQLRKHQVGVEELKAWRPVKKTRGRKSAKRAEPDSE